MPDEKLYTDQDMKNAKEMAKLEARTENLEQFVPEIGSSLRKLSADLTLLKISNEKLPSDIKECGDDLEKDLKEYMHSNFITRRDLYIVFITVGTLFTIVNYVITHTSILE